MKVCSVDGCERKHVARGLCSTHYNQKHQPNRHAKVEVPCTHCGAAILKSKGSSKSRRPFCDYTCRDLYRLEHPNKPGGRVAGISVRIPASHPARWFGATSPLAFGNCRECALLMAFPGYTEKLYCSKECQQKARNRRQGTRPRGHRKHAAFVYERDDYLCWLCGDRVDTTIAAPHPLAATLDHIVPRSLGGSDDPDNLGTAHFICNSKRGASMTLPTVAA